MANRQKVLKVCVVALVMLVSNYAMAEEQVRTREREPKQLNEPEQKYDLELSFPVDSDEATNVIDGRQSRIDALIQEILSNEALVSQNMHNLFEDFLTGIRYGHLADKFSIYNLTELY